MKLIGGGVLVVVALLRVVGFLRSGADPTAIATLLALLIAAGLPAAGGTWLLASHFGAGRGIEQRRARLRQDTMEAEVLKMAGRHNGRLTAVEVAGELAVPTQTAEELLNELMAQGRADIEMTDSGLIVYTFDDVRSLPEKESARGLLEP